MRQVVLDTETTGLEPNQDHRILEIGCVEIVDRRITNRHFHQYIDPQRDIDDGAFEVHGINAEFLADKPVFEALWDDFLAFISGAELVIHNAGFDIAFLNYEMSRMSKEVGEITDYCRVIDTLELARQKHPGQKNSLDALCKRYGVDNSQRELHGALLDAEILADVFLLLTGGQVSLILDDSQLINTVQSASTFTPVPAGREALVVIRANIVELKLHDARLADIHATCGDCIWYRSEPAVAPSSDV